MIRPTILGLIAVTSIYGCSCGVSPSAGQALKSADAVFVGQVTRTSLFDWLFREQTARVKVLEPFKGPPKGANLVFKQPLGSCAPLFTQDTRVLLYAYWKGNDEWTVGACGRGQDSQAEDLLFLRHLPQSATTTRLSGTLALYEDSLDESFRPIRSLAGITVRIASGGQLRSAVTNADGVYEFYGLPPGTYEVTPELSPTLEVQFSIIGGKPGSSSRWDPKVTLVERSDASISFVIRENILISGHVLDPKGNAMPNVCVYAETLDGRQHRWGYDCTEADGTYALKGMPRGHYRIVLNPEDVLSGSMPFHRTYYPGVADRTRAAVVAVDPGKPRTRIDFHLANLEQRTLLRGEVQFLDGVPVPGAWIELVQQGRTLERASSDQSGAFEIATLQGKLHGGIRALIFVLPEALKRCPAWQAHHVGYEIHAADLPVSLEASQRGLLLKLPVRSCAAWPARK